MPGPGPASPRRGPSAQPASPASPTPVMPAAPPVRARASAPGRRQAGLQGAARLPVVNETSAGGLVYRRVGDVIEGALIGRLDRFGVLRWLLPKGHVEDGESATEAAAREVAEETGITGHVVAEIGTIAYWFTAADRRVHKTVHHYVLEADSGELSTDDPEVDDVAWLALPDVLDRLSYDDERRLAALVPALLANEV